MKSTLLVVSTAEAVSHIKVTLDSFFTWKLFDHLTNNLEIINPNGVHFCASGRKVSLSEFNALFFYPDSVEQFLVGKINDEETDGLTIRSKLAFRFALLANLESAFDQKQVFGNRPYTTLKAANRILFYQNRDEIYDSKWNYFSRGYSDEIKESKDSIFRFLPDTHIKKHDQVTAPFLPTELDEAAFSSIKFAHGLDSYANLPFDVRVYGMGSEVIAFFWPRSTDDGVVDVRLIRDSLGDKILDTNSHYLLVEHTEFIRNSFELDYFCIDYVSDLTARYIPVDLNIAPTWYWLSDENALKVNDMLSRYAERFANSYTA